MSQVYVEGLDELLKKFDNLGKAEFIKTALTKSALLVETQAKINCPVDDGQLRQSITSNVGNTQAEVGTNVHYAPYVHQGTGIYAVNGDGRKTKWSYQDEKGEWHTTIGQQPQPFLETALDANKENIRDTFRDEIQREVQK